MAGGFRQRTRPGVAAGAAHRTVPHGAEGRSRKLYDSSMLCVEGRNPTLSKFKHSLIQSKHPQIEPTPAAERRERSSPDWMVPALLKSPAVLARRLESTSTLPSTLVSFPPEMLTEEPQSRGRRLRFARPDAAPAQPAPSLTEISTEPLLGATVASLSEEIAPACWIVPSAVRVSWSVERTMPPRLTRNIPPRINYFQHSLTS